MTPGATAEAHDGFRFAAQRAWDEEPCVADAAVRRVLVMGDVHGGVGMLSAALRVAELASCDVLVSVGDFGLLDTSWSAPGRFARHRYDHGVDLMRRALSAPIPIVVVDGNHEVWPCLTRFGRRPDVGEARAAGRPVHLGGSLWWADRGSTWTWAGRRCGALGGAVSPDKRRATPAGACWPDDEAPTDGDVARLLDNAPDGLDVLFCHDAPWGVRGLRGAPWLFPADVLAEGDDVRRLLRTAVDRAAPALVFHGHWHQANRDSIGDRPSDVFGLASDGRPGYLAALSCETLDAAYTPAGRRSR